MARSKQKTSAKLPEKAGPAGRGTPARETSSSRMDVFDRIAWWCLHALVVVVPLAMSNFGPFNLGGVPLTYDQFDIVKVFWQRGFVLIALGAWAIGLLVRGGKVRFTRVEWVVAAFLGWLVLTTVFSIHPPTALIGKYRRFEGLLSFVTYAAIFFVALQYADRQSRIRSLARSLVIGGFIVAFYGAVQVVGTVGIDVARVLRPVALILGLSGALGAGVLAFGRAGQDPETRRALVIGGVLALAGGIIFHAGLGDNIAIAMQRGLEVVSIDPVRWGNIQFETNRAFSTFGNPDLLGGYLIFPWAIAIALALTEPHRLWRGIYWVFTLMNVFVGITSYVRGAWLGATLSLGIFLVAYWRARSGSDMRLTPLDRVFVIGASTLGAAAMIVSSLRPDAVRNVLTRVISIFQFDQGSALTRFQIWEAARAAIAERPILGWGADTFRLIFPMFKPAEYVEAAGYLSVADNVHNYPLQLAAGVGIPGLLLLYGLIFYALAVSAREVFARGKGPERLLLASLWAAVAGYLLYLLFGLSVTGSTIFLWLAMGVLLSPGAHARDVAPVSRAVALVPVVAAVVIVGIVLNARLLVADHHYLQGRIMLQGTASTDALARAVELNPYNDMYRLSLGDAWYKLFASSALSYASSGDEATRDQALRYLAQAEAGFRDTIAYVPYEYDTYVFFANLYNQAAYYISPQFYTQAVEVARLGVLVSEHGPAVRVQLAVGLAGLGQVEEAIRELEVATSLDSRYQDAWLILGDTYRTAGRTDDARAAFEHVLRRSPDNADALAGIAALEAEESSATTTPTE